MSAITLAKANRIITAAFAKGKELDLAPLTVVVLGIGASLAAKQLGRTDFIITAVDGAPDIEQALKSGNSMIKASASQDPYVMAGKALQMGYEVLQGNKPVEDTVLLEPELITADNVADYKGWTAAR